LAPPGFGGFFKSPHPKIVFRAPPPGGPGNLNNRIFFPTLGFFSSAPWFIWGKKKARPFFQNPCFLVFFFSRTEMIGGGFPPRGSFVRGGFFFWEKIFLPPPLRGAQKSPSPPRRAVFFCWGGGGSANKTQKILGPTGSDPKPKAGGFPKLFPPNPFKTFFFPATPHVPLSKNLN